MNAALGFDTYLVMRHGMRAPPSLSSPDLTAENAKEEPRQRLGCYFCNDVVAPQDSLTDRTLDQQCTVTRPGGSSIASATLIEMLVSLVTHKEG